MEKSEGDELDFTGWRLAISGQLRDMNEFPEPEVVGMLATLVMAARSGATRQLLAEISRAIRAITQDKQLVETALIVALLAQLEARYAQKEPGNG